MVDSDDKQPATAPFDWAVSSDAKSVTIDLRDGRASFTLTTNQLDVTIQWLGFVRERMQPEVSQGVPLVRAEAPLARVALTKAKPEAPIESGAVLHVRSPHFGWLAMNLTAADCQTLVQQMSEPPPPSSLPSMN